VTHGQTRDRRGRWTTGARTTPDDDPSDDGTPDERADPAVPPNDPPPEPSPAPLPLDAVLRYFGAGTPVSATRVAEGLLNRGHRVESSTGRWFLKQYVDPRTAAAGTVRAQHRATVRLHRLGLPVPPPVHSPGGGTLLQLDGCCYALYPWVDGQHRHGTELSHRQCAALGALLARVHRELNRMKPAVPQPRTLPSADPEATDRLIRDLLTRARRPGRDQEEPEFDRLAAEHLSRRRELLAAHAHRRPTEGRTPRTGWVHGDFHPLNLLYGGEAGEGPAAILDWDRLALKPQAEEAVRAATLFFHDLRTGILDLSRLRRFSRAYREAAGTPAEEAAAAVHRVWWERLNDFWILEWHYRHGDRRADPLFPAAAAQILWWCEEYEQVLDAYTN
jgi:Ser/Thr protein kinase RdoA (MazF antagonist)